jgi:hypothetical protein
VAVVVDLLLEAVVVAVYYTEPVFRLELHNLLLLAQHSQLQALDNRLIL